MAYSFFYEDHYNAGSEKVRIVDVRTGQTLASWTQGWDPSCGHTDVVALKLTRAGSAAWTDSDDNRGDCQGALAIQVWTVQAHQQPQLLDSSSTVDPHSLQLHDHTITWIDAGTQRSATIR